jgi:hypothetical protein
VDALEIDRRFTRRQKHPHPHADALIELLWGQTKIHATKVIEITSPGREQSAAITALEESLFWAQAAVERSYR